MKQKITVNGSKEFIIIFKALDTKNELYKEINYALDLLKENVFCGNKIQQELWPEKYIRKYKINTLFRYELRRGWRLIYTIYGTKSEIICTILEVLTHKEYEKRFGY